MTACRVLTAYFWIWAFRLSSLIMPTRGFSYHKDAPLDMRMSKSGLTAADIVASYSVSELTRIFRDYGEEKFAYKIALRIADEREKQPIVSTLQLSDIIASAVPAKARQRRSPREKMLSA